MTYTLHNPLFVTSQMAVISPNILLLFHFYIIDLCYTPFSGVVQLFRTCSNHSSTQETRPPVELDMSSGWFNLSEPVRTTELQREQGS